LRGIACAFSLAGTWTRSFFGDGVMIFYARYRFLPDAISPTLLPNSYYLCGFPFAMRCVCGLYMWYFFIPKIVQSFSINTPTISRRGIDGRPLLAAQEL
jgi:hypothetical protein